jgi:glycerol-3-phosphate O-acyltransferase
MAPTVTRLAELLMTRINAAAAVNGLTLSALALLAAERHALTRDELQAQLNTYLDLLKQVPYSPQSTIPAEDAKTLLDQAMELNKFEVSEDKLGQIISLDRYQAILLTYYRNNILHLFALPSLVAALIERCEGISRGEIVARCVDIYPLLKTELFLRYEEDELPELVDALLAELQRQQLVEARDGGYWVNPGNQMRLLLLAESIQETLQRYAIVLTRVLAQPHVEAEQLEADGLMMAERLGTLHGINAPEFFDQKLFSTLIHTLRKEGYLSPECKPDLGRFQALADNIVPLLSNKIRRTIQAGNRL